VPGQNLATIEAELTRTIAELLIDDPRCAQFAVAADGEIVSWNAGAEHLFGMAAKAAIGTSLFDVGIAPTVLRRAVAETIDVGRSDLMSRCTNSGAVETELEITLRTLRGTERPLIAVRALPRNGTNLLEEMERSAIAVATVDEHGGFVRVNMQFTKLWGFSDEETSGATCDLLLGPSDRAKALLSTLATEAHARGTGGALEMILYDRGGTRRPTKIVFSPVASGERSYVLLSFHDISAEVYAKTRFRDLLEAAPDAMVIVNRTGAIQLVNAQTERMFGFQREELIGKPVELLIPARYKHHSANREKFFTDPRVRSMGSGLELQGVRKDGTEFPVEISLSPLETPDGLLVTSTIRDITERKRLEDTVQEASRYKSEFLANMSHELRTPLNAIIGFADLMFKGKAGELAAHHREYLGDILTSARHLLQLINDILDLAKVESGKMDFRPEPIDMTRLVGEIRDVMRGMAALKRLQIRTEIADDLDVVSDPARLKQILYNFVSNAIKFSSERSDVIIRVLAEGETQFRIEVQDHGVGIAAADMSCLFIEFQQLEGGAAMRFQGSGLGLALTKRIVDGAGGKISVKSEIGVGSTFVATLPRIALVGEP